MSRSRTSKGAVARAGAVEGDPRGGEEVGAAAGGVLTPNGFELQYLGICGFTVQFERSVDLTHWTTVATMPVPPFTPPVSTLTVAKRNKPGS